MYTFGSPLQTHSDMMGSKRVCDSQAINRNRDMVEKIVPLVQYRLFGVEKFVEPQSGSWSCGKENGFTYVLDDKSLWKRCVAHFHNRVTTEVLSSSPTA